MGIYFAKDFLVLLVYLSFFAAYRRKDPDVKIFRPPFFPILLVFIWYAAIQVLIPVRHPFFLLARDEDLLLLRPADVRRLFHG